MVLKRHHRQSHNAPLPDPQSSLEAAEVREHSLDGMPVCKHCCKDFVTWFNLKRHLQKGHCTARWTDQAADTPPILSSGRLPSWIRLLCRYNYLHQRHLPQLFLPCLRLPTSTLARFLSLRHPGLFRTRSALSWLLMCPPNPRTGYASLVGLKLSKSFVASVAFVVVSGWPTSAVPSFTIGRYIRPSMRSSTRLRQPTVNVSAILYHLVHFVVL